MSCSVETAESHLRSQLCSPLAHLAPYKLEVNFGTGEVTGVFAKDIICQFAAMQAVVQPATLPAAFVAGSKAKIARGKGKVAGKSSGGAPIPHILLTRVHSLQNEYYSHRRKYAIILVLKF